MINKMTTFTVESSDNPDSIADPGEILGHGVQFPTGRVVVEWSTFGGFVEVYESTEGFRRQTRDVVVAESDGVEIDVQER